MILKNNTRSSRHFVSLFNLLDFFDMQTISLWYDKVVSLDHITASFSGISEGVQDVLLEINSNKFLIRMQAGLEALSSFELIAVQWCVEIGVKFMRFLKRLVSVLYFEY